MKQFVYDSGALIAIDKKNDAAMRRHEFRLGRGHRIIVPAPVAAQMVRDPRRQAQLMLTIRGCLVVPFGKSAVSPVGKLLARAGTADVVDGFVAFTAAAAGAAVVTSDADEISRLLDALGAPLPVLAP
jgi:predicted nucleic acid-binding protein